MSSFQELVQTILRVLLLRPLPPTSVQVTSKALKTYRVVVQQAGNTSLTILPPELSFNHIISNKAGYPISRREFLTYLSEETRTAENFQFLLFVLNYAQFYHNLSSQGAASLSPPFTEQDEKEAKRSIIAARRASRSSITPPATSHSNFTDFGIFTGPSSITSYTPPTSSSGESSHTKAAVFSANTQLSDEVEKCLALYIRQHSSRELNISDLDRAMLGQAILQSNHPDVFRLITRQLEPLLRASYLDFINATVRSPTFSTKSLAARLCGPVLVVCSLIAAVIMTLSKLRWEFRTLVIPLLFCGVVTSFCVEREAFVWCGEGVEELLEEGGMGKRKRELRVVVMTQGVWAGVLAVGLFFALFLFVPNGNKF